LKRLKSTRGLDNNLFIAPDKVASGTVLMGPKEWTPILENEASKELAAFSKRAVYEVPNEKLIANIAEVDTKLSINNQYYKERNFATIERYEQVIDRDKDTGNAIRDVLYVATTKDGKTYISHDGAADPELTQRIAPLVKEDKLLGPVNWDYKGEVQLDNIKQYIEPMTLMNKYEVNPELSKQAYKDTMKVLETYTAVVPDFDEKNRIDTVYIAKDEKGNIFKADDKGMDPGNPLGPGKWRGMDQNEYNDFKDRAELKDYSMPGNTAEKINERYKENEPSPIQTIDDLKNIIPEREPDFQASYGTPQYRTLDAETNKIHSDIMKENNADFIKNNFVSVDRYEFMWADKELNYFQAVEYIATDKDNNVFRAIDKNSAGKIEHVSQVGKCQGPDKWVKLDYKLEYHIEDRTLTNSYTPVPVKEKNIATDKKIIKTPETKKTKTQDQGLSM